MIILKQLRWSNCFSYGPNNTLDLHESGLTQVLGANGVGKSSIPLIIEEILYNKNSKNVKKVDIPNRDLDGGYSMGLDLSVDSDEFVIEVERKKNLKISLSKNGADISSHTATATFKTIEGILGIDFKTFSQLVYQNTSSSLGFLTATDTTRKKFLIDLLGLNRYVEYFDIFKGLVKDSSSELIAIESKIDTVEKWLSKNNLEGMKTLSSIKLEINTEEEEKQLGSLTAEFRNILETNKKISKNNLYKDQLASIDLSSVAHVTGVIVNYDDLNEQIGRLKSTIDSDSKLIKQYENVSSECPTCGQHIDTSFADSEVVRLKERLIEFKAKRGEIADQILAITKQNQAIKEKERMERDFESLYTSIDRTLPKYPLDAKEFEEKIEKLESKIAEKRKKIEEIIAENARIDKNNTRIQVIKEQRGDFQEQLDILSSSIEDVSKLHSNLEVLKKAFSTNGLLAYKIEYLVKELESIVNEYLAELSDGRFTLTFVVSKDKLNVEITDNGKLVDILSLSSGELARVNTSTLLAIRRLMNSISKSQINVLFLDEVIGVLDDMGREKLVDVLVQETKLNTFIVSHEWSHPLLNKLNVMKEDNISKLIKE